MLGEKKKSFLRGISIKLRVLQDPKATNKLLYNKREENEKQGNYTNINEQRDVLILRRGGTK